MVICHWKIYDRLWSPNRGAKIGEEPSAPVQPVPPQLPNPGQSQTTTGHIAHPSRVFSTTCRLRDRSMGGQRSEARAACSLCGAFPGSYQPLASADGRSEKPTAAKWANGNAERWKPRSSACVQACITKKSTLKVFAI